jgi:hypothetical protein
MYTINYKIINICSCSDKLLSMVSDDYITEVPILFISIQVVVTGEV